MSDDLLNQPPDPVEDGAGKHRQNESEHSPAHRHELTTDEVERITALEDEFPFLRHSPSRSAATDAERLTGHKDDCPYLFFDQGECNCGASPARERTTGMPKSKDPLHDALVAIFEAIAEREKKTIEEVVAEFVERYEGG